MKQLLVAFFTLVIGSVPAALAQAPDQIAYQGLLYDGGAAVTNGSATLLFSLYTVNTDGTALWTETQTGVDISDGQFFVYLGSVATLSGLAFDVPYWLEVSYEGTALEPRLELVGVPYARTSATAESVPWSGITGIPSGFSDGTDDVGDECQYLQGSINTISLYWVNFNLDTEIWITIFDGLKQAIYTEQVYEGTSLSFGFETSTASLGDPSTVDVSVTGYDETGRQYSLGVVKSVGSGISSIHTEILADLLAAGFDTSDRIQLQITTTVTSGSAPYFRKFTAGYYSTFGWVPIVQDC